MNWERVTDEWKQLKEKLVDKLAKLTDDEIDAARSSDDVALGQLQLEYLERQRSGSRKMDEYLARQ